MKIEHYINQHNPLLTDSGLETTLIFHHDIDLPHFAAFSLLDKPAYDEVFKTYYTEHLEVAKKHQTGFILESATWRANKDWGFKLGYNEDELTAVNILAIDQLKEIRQEYKDDLEPIYISGQIGPSKDGYTLTEIMSVDEAKNYHDLQVSAFSKAEVDLISALTISYINEGLGIVKSAMEHNVQVVISFTVETDGKLPSGELLKEAIETIDNATNNYPLYYMINCAHPSHFINVINETEDWTLRIKAIRANASCKSHEELDESTEIDVGDKEELANLHNRLIEKLPNLTVFGGCCGTDVSHIEAICNKIYLKV